MSQHDLHSDICQRQMLKMWRSKSWKNSPISDEIHLISAHSNWPSPDGAMYDPKKEISIGIEFKPYYEKKRGVQTAIGQSLTYLDKFSASYIIIPEKAEDFEIANYLTPIFKKQVYNKMPIGLLSYDHKTMKIKMLVDIGLEINFITKKSRGIGRYFAKFIDSNPHIIFLLLDIAINNKHLGKDEVWKKFFDDYYYPERFRNKLVPFESEIDHWGKKKMEPFRDKIKVLKNMVNSGKISENQAINNELNQHISNEGRPFLSKSSQSDNLFKSYRKNFMTFLDHLELWDINANVSELGEELYSIGKIYGHNSTEFINRFAKILLEEGNHLAFIYDVKKYTDSSFDSITDAKHHVEKRFEEEGLLKRNLSRASEPGNTKDFSNQFQLWSKLGVISKKGNKSVYKKGHGFIFNEKRIDEILNSTLKK